MHTEKRFNELTSISLSSNARTPDAEPINFADISPAAKARITALSEALRLSEQKILEELLDSALGDAHDGFLAAFKNAEERNSANQKLKSRVKALLRRE